MNRGTKIGAKIVAVTDWKGGVYNEKGIDVEKLIAHVQQHRTVDGFSGGDPLATDKLWGLDVHVLIPAALENQITMSNAPAIKAKVKVTKGKDEIDNGVTDAKGLWSFKSPPPGKYEIHADAGAGHNAKTSITIPGATTEPESAAALSTTTTAVASRTTRSCTAHSTWAAATKSISMIRRHSGHASRPVAQGRVTPIAQTSAASRPGQPSSASITRSRSASTATSATT